MLTPNMASFDDKEGHRVPAGLPSVIDAHVHVFPDKMFSAVWKWFDDNAWPIRYRMNTSQVFEFLFCRGVHHIIALQYAHKPGISRYLNKYMVEECRNYKGRVTGMATVFPGEEDSEAILQEAFDSGLGGLKLHAHVQCFDMNSRQMEVLYDCCSRNSRPVVMHVGREPKSNAYSCDPYDLCSSGKVQNILQNFSELKICVPHLGFDEQEDYRKLVQKYDNLWLDTTMVITDYFPGCDALPLDAYRMERIMYGSDFPNIPYAWDRELKKLMEFNLSLDDLEKISSQNARDFFGLDFHLKGDGSIFSPKILQDK